MGSNPAADELLLSSSNLSGTSLKQVSHIDETIERALQLLAVYLRAKQIQSAKTKNSKKMAHSTMDSVLALHPAAPGSILGVPKNFSL